MSEEKNCEYLGIQALPPRKKGRDRRRLNKNLNIPLEDDEKKEMESTVAEVVDDPFSPMWKSLAYSCISHIDLRM